MGNDLELYHGAPGDNILSIIRVRAMRPDSSHKIYFSNRFEDALQHGADLKRKAAYAFKAKVTIPAGATVARESRPGNPVSVIVTTALPLPTEILELYVRLPRATRIEIVKGIEAIKLHLA